MHLTYAFGRGEVGVPTHRMLKRQLSVCSPFVYGLQQDVRKFRSEGHRVSIVPKGAEWMCFEPRSLHLRADRCREQFFEFGAPRVSRCVPPLAARWREYFRLCVGGAVVFL